MRKYSAELSSPSFDYEGGHPVMDEHPNGDYYEVYEVDREIARLQSALSDAIALNNEHVAREDLLKAALRWLVTEGRDGCIETPLQFAAVIAEATK